MFFNCGWYSHRFRRCGMALLSAAVLPFTTAVSQELSAGGQPVLGVSEAAQIALAGEAVEQALLAQADALREQAVAAAQLPDPILRVGVMNYPIEAGGFSTEAMTSAQVGVRQAFPPGQTRALSARRFQVEADAVTANAQARRRHVLEQVRQRWLEAWYFIAAQGTLAEMQPLFDDLVEIATSLYSVGHKDQQDVLAAQLQASRLEDRLLELQRREAGSRAMLGNWVGSEAHRPLPDELPSWPSPPPLQQLQQQLAQHPALLAADQQIVARAAAIGLAEQQKKPGWAIDVGYAYRDGRLPGGQSRSDFVSVGVMFDLPLFRENRQDRRVAAAVSERRATQQQREALWLQLSSELQKHYDNWRDLTRRLQLYEQTLLPATRAQTEAALLAYQSDAGDFADVLRSAITELETHLDYLRLQVDRASTWSSLANLGGMQS